MTEYWCFDQMLIEVCQLHILYDHLCVHIPCLGWIHMFLYIFNDNQLFYYHFRSQEYINSSQLIMLSIDWILMFRSNVGRNISITHIVRPLMCLCFWAVFGVHTHVFNDDSSFYYDLWSKTKTDSLKLIMLLIFRMMTLWFMIEYWSKYVEYACYTHE